MRFAAVGLLFAGVLLTVGCGGGEKMVQIKGKVLLDGKPVKAGDIEFVPDTSKETEGAKAIGIIKDGEFSLYTGAKEGVLVGHHQVAVKCPFRIDEGSSAEGDTDGGGTKGGCPIPKKYWDVTTSELTEEVKSKDQEITINLKSK
jgi:hypothetical protein